MFVQTGFTKSSGKFVDRIYRIPRIFSQFPDETEKYYPFKEQYTVGKLALLPFVDNIVGSISKLKGPFCFSSGKAEEIPVCPVDPVSLCCGRIYRIIRIFSHKTLLSFFRKDRRNSCLSCLPRHSPELVEWATAGRSCLIFF
jgi:hypothetical protein